MAGRTVLTIGNFDGVHAGHAALLRRARDLADAGGERGRVVAMAFDPHPLRVLRPDIAPPTLTTFAQRERLLRDAGADEVARLDPRSGVLREAPEQFADEVVERFAPVAVVEGPDFRFGKGRAGDVRTLAALGATRGFEVDVVEPVRVTLTDCRVCTASSTLARWLLSHGRVRDAAVVLGRAYEIDAEVVRGARRGREIGFPTANLRFETLAPAEGVYAGRAVLPDGGVRVAAISVGSNPTFDDGALSVEAHLLDWSGPAHETGEYGWRVRLRFESYLRGQERYEGVAPLVRQIERDIARTREIIQELPGEPCAAAAASNSGDGA